MTRAIIAGGGIVGLTTGRALLRAGMEVLVAEKADAIRVAGATLGLWGNAVSVFDDLNVDVRSVGRDGFEEDQDSVTVRFSDGATEQADLLIGADGLCSKVRTQLLPGTEAQEHAGHRAWRAIVKAERIDVPDDRLIVGGKHRDPRWLRPRPRRHRVLAAVAVRRAGTGRVGEGGVPCAVCLAHRWHLGLQAHRAH